MRFEWYTALHRTVVSTSRKTCLKLILNHPRHCYWFVCLSTGITLFSSLLARMGSHTVRKFARAPRVNNKVSQTFFRQFLDFWGLTNSIFLCFFSESKSRKRSEVPLPQSGFSHSFLCSVTKRWPRCRFPAGAPNFHQNRDRITQTALMRRKSVKVAA